MLKRKMTRTGLVPHQLPSNSTPTPRRLDWVEPKRMYCLGPSFLSLIELENDVKTNHTDVKWLYLS